MTDSLRRLGKSISDRMDHFPDEHRILRAGRARLEEHLESRQEGAFLWWRSRRWWTVTGVGLGVLIAVVFAISSRVLEAEEPIGVTVEADPAPALGRWVVAEQETKQLRFSDGTRLSIHPETRVRVEEARKNGATVRLGEGRTLAQVTPRKNATWRFVAGPFSVLVTGTEFDLSWKPEAGVLELALHEGAVTVSGPSLSNPKRLQRGDFLRLTAPPSVADPQQREGAGLDNDSEGPHFPASETGRNEENSTDAKLEAIVGPDGAGTASGPATANDATGSRGSSEAPWGELLRSGKQKEAVAAVLRQGKDQALASATSEQLWAITRAARMSGHPQLASDALLALRKQHGARGETAYLLGKVHADQLHVTSKAISWFETYLQETPSGPLAEQALGRLVELESTSRRGKTRAKEYLQRFPNGPHAKFARSLLQSSSF